MEIICYFKLHCLIQVIIPKYLINIFKVRFNIENEAEQFVFIKQLINSYDSIFYNGLFSHSEKDIIEKCIIEKYSFKILSNLLINIHQLNNNIINKESYDVGFNKEKEVLNNLYNYVMDYVYNLNFKESIQVELYNEIRDRIIGFLKQLNVKENEVLYYLDTLQLDNELNLKNGGVNSQSEEIVLEIKEKCNENFSKGNINQSYKRIIEALNYSSISSYLKSILYLNISIYEFKENILFCNQFDSLISTLPTSITISPTSTAIPVKETLFENEIDGGLELLLKSKQYAMNAILHRPSWGKSYYRLGLVLSRLSNYSSAVSLFEAALLLNSKNGQNTLEENRQIIKSLNEAKSKLEVITRSLKFDGISRDYENETKIILYEKFKWIDVLEKKFNKYSSGSSGSGHISISKDKKKKIFSDFKDQVEKLKLKGIPEKIALDYISTYSVSNCGSNINISCSPSTFKDKYSKEQKFEIISRVIGSGSNVALPYVIMSFQHEQDPITQLSLLMKASTLSIPLISNNNNNNKEECVLNYDVITAQQSIALVYKGNKLQDYDLDKSNYYLQKSLENQTKLNSINNNNNTVNSNSSTQLGNSSNFNISNNNNYNSISIFNNQDNYFNWTLPNLIDDSFNSTLSENEIISRITIFSNKEYNYPIDINQVLESINGEGEEECSEYSKKVFQIFYDISKFIELFECKYLNLKNDNSESSDSDSGIIRDRVITIDEKIELIKPLANVYCQKDYYEYIRFNTSSILNELSTFINSLYEEAPTNKIVVLCYLSLNQSLSITQKIRIINKLHRLVPSNNLKKFQDEYDETIEYLLCTYYILNDNNKNNYNNNNNSNNNNIGKSIGIALDYSTFSNSSYCFNLLVLYYLMLFGNNNKNILIENKEMLSELYDKSIQFIQLLPSGHPNIALYHCTLASLVHLSKVKDSKFILHHLEKATILIKKLPLYLAKKVEHLNLYLNFVNNLIK